MELPFNKNVIFMTQAIDNQRKTHKAHRSAT